MQEKNSNPFRKKQVKTMTFLVTLLIAATLILGSAVSAISTSGKSNEMNTMGRNISGTIRDFSPNTKTALNIQENKYSK